VATQVLGDRESKEAVVYKTIDLAFSDRVSKIFDSLCVNIESETATRLFLDRFKVATSAWTLARDAISEEYAPPAP
jgi:hypothetical protein